MASAVDICNAALSLIGARAHISNLTPPDGSVEAGYCARFYPMARREMLQIIRPRNARRRVKLVQVDNTSDAWAYAYATPSDMIDALRVLSSCSPLTRDSLERWHTGDRGSAGFVLEGGVLLTNEPDATLVYLFDQTDVSTYSPLTQSAISMRVAAYLAGPIIKGDAGTNVGVRWRQASAQEAAVAAAADANSSSSETGGHLPETIAVRS